MPTVDIGGLEIAYTEKGEGDVLLVYPDHLHASRAYEHEIDHFAERFRVIAFDYPGTGRSTRETKFEDERQYDLWTFRSDLGVHLLMALEVDAAYALGVGGGARAALHFAGKHARLHKLTAKGVIADSFLPTMDARALHRILDAREHYYVRNNKRLQQEHGEDWREVVDADTAFLRRIADHGGYQLHEAILNGIACPVLLTGCLSDPLRPGLAGAYAQLATLIPDCSIYLASTSGHPYIETPFIWSNTAAFRTVADLFFANGRS